MGWSGQVHQGAAWCHGGDLEVELCIDILHCVLSGRQVTDVIRVQVFKQTLVSNSMASRISGMISLTFFLQFCQSCYNRSGGGDFTAGVVFFFR